MLKMCTNVGKAAYSYLLLLAGVVFCWQHDLGVVCIIRVLTVMHMQCYNQGPMQ